jgi:hypothetical protein
MLIFVDFEGWDFRGDDAREYRGHYKNSNYLKAITA